MTNIQSKSIISIEIGFGKQDSANKRIVRIELPANDGKCVVDEKFLIEKLKLLGYFENVQVWPLFGRY